MPHTYYAYILTNPLYVGVTNNFPHRLYEHRNHLAPDFSARYHANVLVYEESTARAEAAIAREKQTKSWRRSRKLALTESRPPLA